MSGSCIAVYRSRSSSHESDSSPMKQIMKNNSVEEFSNKKVTINHGDGRIIFSSLIVYIRGSSGKNTPNRHDSLFDEHHVLLV